jgi:hypothetical protein
MPRTILCQKCGLILNLPDRIAAGKRMKCPKCAHRFEITERDASSASTAPGTADAATLSSHELARRPPSHDDLPIPTADHDLRDMFESPMGTGASIEEAAVGSRKQVLSDAEALFRDEPERRRKPRGAEARLQARRCKNCGGVVPQGMSICATCGVDQETGMRVGLEDDLAPATVLAPSGPPLHIAITGFLCGLASVLLLVLSLIQSIRDSAGVTQYGWLCLALVSAFGIYGAVQFYLGKSVKLLMLALTLGVFVDLMALIAMPIYQANFEPKDRVISRRVQVKNNEPDSLDDADVEIKPIEERIDHQKINMGLTFIGVYVALSVYLLSPSVKRYFVRQAAIANLPLPI